MSGNNHNMGGKTYLNLRMAAKSLEDSAHLAYWIPHSEYHAESVENAVQKIKSAIAVYEKEKSNV